MGNVVYGLRGHQSERPNGLRYHESVAKHTAIPMNESAPNARNGRGKIGVLVSGGLDSLILLGHLLREGHFVQPIYIRCGLVWESAELAALQQICQALGNRRLERLVVLDLPVRDLYESHWSITGEAVPAEDSPPQAVFLPARNALLILKAGVWCLLHDVTVLALGILSTNPFDDARPEFFAHVEEVLRRSLGRSLRIVAPFATLTKREAMALGKDLPLELSFSCIDPQEGLHCGRCNKCAERKEAFAEAAIPDRTQYYHPRSLPAVS